jgi:glucan biosynthesis protein
METSAFWKPYETHKCGQNAEFQYVIASGAHSNHWALNCDDETKLLTFIEC